MTTNHDAAVAFSSLCSQDARLMKLVTRYDNDTSSLSEAEFNEMCARMDRIYNNPFVQKMVFEAMEDEDED